MPRVPADYVPAYRLHKQSGQAIVTLNHRDHLLGPYGTPDSRARYHELIAIWEKHGRHLPDALPRLAAAAAAERVTIRRLCDRFERHAATYYRRPDGTPSNEPANFKPVLDLMRDTFGDIEPDDFTPSRLKALRERMIARGWVRASVNQQVGRVRRVIKWAVSEELAKPATLAALQAVAPLAPGRSGARESEPVESVSPEHVVAIRPHVSPVVWAIVQLQRLTGARGDELLRLRPCDLDMRSETWVYRPSDHKTSWRGHTRTIHFGPRAQQVLQPFLTPDRPLTAYVFSPRESNAARKADTREGEGRRPNQKPNRRKTDRTIRDRFDHGTYRRAIHRACDLAKIPRWSPHRLRHLRAEETLAMYGEEATKAVLGDRSPSMVTRYAGVNHSLAARVASEVG